MIYVGISVTGKRSMSCLLMINSGPSLFVLYYVELDAATGSFCRDSLRPVKPSAFPDSI